MDGGSEDVELDVGPWIANQAQKGVLEWTHAQIKNLIYRPTTKLSEIMVD